MEKFDKYIANSQKYWAQALENLNLKEFEKSSELVWGSVAEYLKALALIKTGLVISTHKGIRDFVKRFSLETGDEKIYKTYRNVESLHSNFYESGLEPEDVQDIILEARELILKLNKFMVK